MEQGNKLHVPATLSLGKWLRGTQIPYGYWQEDKSLTSANQTLPSYLSSPKPRHYNGWTIQASTQFNTNARTHAHKDWSVWLNMMSAANTIQCSQQTNQARVCAAMVEYQWLEKQRLKWLLAGLSPQRPRFGPWPVNVGFAVDEVALRQVFSASVKHMTDNIRQPLFHHFPFLSHVPE